MKTSRFRTRQDSTLFTMPAGHRIAPLVAERLVAIARWPSYVTHMETAGV